MQNRTKNIAIALGLFTLVTLGLGKYFDSRCGTSCITEALAANGNLEKYNIHITNGTVTYVDGKDENGDKTISIHIGDKDEDGGDDSENPARIREALKEAYAGKDLKTISIISHITDWKISEGADDKVNFAFKGYLPGKEWVVKETAGRLEIELKKKGPLAADLLLPKDFKGVITMTNVSGDLEVEKLAKTEVLNLTNVSGGVKIRVAPVKSLLLNSVSGDIEFEPASVNKDLRVDMNTVTGDVNSTLNATIQSFAVKSVNGDFTLKTGKTAGFMFEMEGVNASFNGLPRNSERTDSYVHGEVKGSFGADPKGKLSFESVNGDFQLENAE